MPIAPLSPPPAPSSRPTTLSKVPDEVQVARPMPRPSTSRSRIPRLILPDEAITDVMAGHLAMALLGHVLFLKSQVPLPVVQLARMPPSQNSRATKKRTDLLAALDTLSSHLTTTFTALSTALALASTHSATPTADSETDTGLQSRTPTARAELAMVLGPSASTAKARVVLALDGLLVKAWGVREDNERPGERQEDRGEDEDEFSSDEDEVFSEETYSEEDGSSEDDSNDDSDAEEDDSPPSSSPSPSPSPSPTPSTALRLPPPPTRSHSAPQAGSRAEEDASLRAAARLLAHALAESGAPPDGDEVEEGGGGEGCGMVCEMPPTQTHILLRAPRRFGHPAWTPRAEIGRIMDGVLDEFVGACSPNSEIPGGKRKSKGKPVEGVWVGCHGRDGGRQTEPELVVGVAEEDEMIWWTWDGKINGFSEW